MPLPKPSSCSTCPGYGWPCPSPGQGFVRPQISQNWNRVLLVFEAAGEHESLVGLPLQGAAGQTFEGMLQRGGLERQHFDIANVLSCRPPKNLLVGQSYEATVIDHCAHFLDQLIADRKPRCIVAGGAVALRRLLPFCPVGIDEARGYVHWSSEYSCWIVPTIHPSRILRGQTALTAVFIHDVTKAVEIAREGFEYLDTSFYTLDPPPPVAEQWVKAFETAVACRRVQHLSCDIETPDKGEEEDALEDEDLEDADIRDASYEIIRCGYSYHDTITGKVHAISMPWGGIQEVSLGVEIDASPYMQCHRRLLESPCDKLWWNKSFDVPRVVSAGVHLRGVQHDGMESWHVLNSDLRRSLGSVSSFLGPKLKMWKHLSAAEPAFYNTQDAYAADNNHIKTCADLKKHQLWPVYVEQVLEMDPVYSSMSAAGMPINAAKRLEFAKVLTGLQQAVRAEMQRVVPDACRRVEPKDGYKREPSPEQLDSLRAKLEPGETLQAWLFEAREIKRCSGCQVVDPAKGHFKSKTSKVCSDCGKKWTAKHAQRKGAGGHSPCLLAHCVETETNACAGSSVVTTREGITRWARVQPFSPSPKQIQAYMLHHGHALQYKGRGDQKKPTTDIKAMKKIRAAHAADLLYPLIMKDRKLDKLSGTYVGRYQVIDGVEKVVGGFPVGKDGRVHAQFTNAPSTLRTSMRSPNLQNLPR